MHSRHLRVVLLLIALGLGAAACQPSSDDDRNTVDRRTDRTSLIAISRDHQLFIIDNEHSWHLYRIVGFNRPDPTRLLGAVPAATGELSDEQSGLISEVMSSTAVRRITTGHFDTGCVSSGGGYPTYSFGPDDAAMLTSECPGGRIPGLEDLHVVMDAVDPWMTVEQRPIGGLTDLENTIRSGGAMILGRVKSLGGSVQIEVEDVLVEVEAQPVAMQSVELDVAGLAQADSAVVGLLEIGETVVAVITDTAEITRLSRIEAGDLVDDGQGPDVFSLGNDGVILGAVIDDDQHREVCSLDVRIPTSVIATNLERVERRLARVAIDTDDGIVAAARQEASEAKPAIETRVRVLDGRRDQGVALYTEGGHLIATLNGGRLRMNGQPRTRAMRLTRPADEQITVYLFNDPGWHACSGLAGGRSSEDFRSSGLQIGTIPAEDFRSYDIELDPPAVVRRTSAEWPIPRA